MRTDLRRVSPHSFVNDRDGTQQEAFLRAVERAEATQRHRYCVAPTCTLQLTDGRMLREGHSLVADDLVGLVGADPRRHESPIMALRRHLFETRVLECGSAPELSAYEDEAGPVEYVPISASREGLPIRFGDDESRERFEREIVDAYDRQRVRFAVAPRCNLAIPDGRLLPSGATLALRDLIGSIREAPYGDGPRAETAIEAMRREIRAGRVIYSRTHPEVPAAPAPAAAE